MEEIAAARHFAATQAVVQIVGTCEECRTGASSGPSTSAIDGATTELVFARDALRIAIATERSGLEFYTRAAGLTKDPRGRSVFPEAGRRRARAPRHAREALPRADRRRSPARVAADVSVLQGRRPADCLPRAPSSSARASTISRRCSSASSASAGRTTSSNGTASASRTRKAKRIFLEFADEERVHRDLLINEYRALRERREKKSRRPRGTRTANASRRREVAPLIDLHTHTTASDGRCTPPELVARAAAAGVTVLSVTDHDTTAACAPVSAACARAGIEFVPGIEITAVVDGADVHMLGYFIDPESRRRSAHFSPSSAAGASIGCA